jgi:beta-xylosidase
MYKDPSAPIEERIADLLGRMTVEEKVAQLCGIMPLGLFGASGLDPDKMKSILGNGMGQISMLAMFGHKSPPEMARASNAIQEFLAKETRLGIPVIVHNEALNGFVAPEAPNFPTAIGLAATWSPELVERMTDLIRQQMRAVGVHQALSPVMDVARDARWGRVHETYGEDPYLCSAMSTAFVKGLQGSDLKEGVVATGKHFLGYGLSEAGQNMAATQIGPRELYEAFARPFEAAIRDAGLASIMNSYSEIDGIPVGSSRGILTDLLRGRMGFQGFVVSDYMTVMWLAKRQGTAASPQEAGIQALTAGLDVELPTSWGYGPPLVEAVQKGLMQEDVLDTAVRRVLQYKFRLGLFESPYVDVGKAQPAYVDPENGRLSYEMACKSLTLLKNKESLLPLPKDLSTIAVIGPHADSVGVYFPGYTYPGVVGMMRSGFLSQREGDEGSMAGVQEDMGLGAEAMQALVAEMAPIIAVDSVDEYIKQHYPAQSVLEAVGQTVAEGTKVLYAQGCDVKEELAGGIAEAVAAAEKADAVIFAGGGQCGWLGGGTEGEGRDTANVALPGAQRRLLQAVVATGTPVVAVLFQGRPYAIPWAAEHVPAILVAYYPGQEGGGAIASALFGDLNPGGKLPVTIPRHSGQVPIYHSHKMGSGYQRAEGDMHQGYTDMPSTPLYAFGHGLSYTSFAYSNLRLSAEQVDSRDVIEIACDVTNTGDLPGDEVVQLYVRDREATVTRPVQELVGFKRVGLEPGATCTVTFTVEMRQLGFYNRQMEFVVEPGNIDVMIGSSSADVRLTGAFEITGDVVNVMGRRAFASQVTVTGQAR